MEPWAHAVNLHRAVEAALEAQNLAHLQVRREDVEGAKPLVRALWRGEWRADPLAKSREGVVPGYLLLGFLGGHFFDRDLPENDLAFWPEFHRALGLNQGQPTPKQRDKLWKVLEGLPGTKAFLRFHADGKRDFVGTLKALFGARTLRLKEILDHLRLYRDEAKLQEEALGPYASLVRGLKEALDLLAEEALDAAEQEDVEALVARLEALGFYAEEPHPLRFLFHRSPKAFAELYAEWRGEKKATPLRHPQVRVEVLQGKEVLERVLPQIRREVLVEGALVYGQVRLKSGLFRGFCWRPRLDTEGNPIPEEVAVPLGEGQVVLRLHHRAWGVRFLDERGQVCPEWRPPEPLEVRPLVDEGTPVRFLLEGGGDPVERLEDLPLELGLPEDALAVEALVFGSREHGEWRPLGRLPVRLEARLEERLSETALELEVFPRGPLETVWLAPAGPKQTFPEGRACIPRGLWPVKILVKAWGRAWEILVPPKGWPEKAWRRGLGLPAVGANKLGNNPSRFHL